MNFSIDLQHKDYSSDAKALFSDEDLNTPVCFNQIPPINQTSQQQNKKEKKVPYRWLPQQHKQYISFLIQRRELFDMTLQRKIVMGIHNLMSQYIKNRTSLQCRSHHQKMLVKYKTIDNIIAAHSHLFQTINKEQTTQISENNINDFFDSKIEGRISFLQDIFAFKVFPESRKAQPEVDGLVEIESYQYNQNFSFELD